MCLIIFKKGIKLNICIYVQYHKKKGACLISNNLCRCHDGLRMTPLREHCRWRAMLSSGKAWHRDTISEEGACLGVISWESPLVENRSDKFFSRFAGQMYQSEYFRCKEQRPGHKLVYAVRKCAVWLRNWSSDGVQRVQLQPLNPGSSTLDLPKLLSHPPFGFVLRLVARWMQFQAYVQTWK